MAGFGRMHKIGRGAGRGKGRRHLTSDMTGFAHTRHNDAARRRQHQPDCAHESIAQFRGQFQERFRFGMQYATRQRQNTGGVRFGEIICSASGWVCRHG